MESTSLNDDESPVGTKVFDADQLGFTVNSSRVMSLDTLLDKFRVDREMWDIIDQTVNKWDVTAFARITDKEGNIIKKPFTHENFQIKARCKKKVDIVDWPKFKQEFIDSVKKASPHVPEIKRRKPPSDYSRNLYEPNLYDLHLGKLGWSPETGDGNYDYKIAWDRAEYLIDDMIMKATVYPIERIMLPLGHDFFNSDHENTGTAQTNAGTFQQNEGRWQKMWKAGRDLAIMFIEKLKTVAPVDVKIVPGNHDLQKMFYLGDLLEVKYENDKNVTVDNRPVQRKYYLYGKSLLGLIHKVGGKDAPNEQRLLQLMPAERESKKMFAETEFHEWHCGHYHYSKKNSQPNYHDHQGIVIRYMRSPTNADAWHSNSGYVGAVKGSEGMIINHETGPMAHFTHNIIF